MSEIVMKTAIKNDGVYYEVIDQDGKVAWKAMVKFGPKNPSGGPAFQRAAHEQETEATKLWSKINQK